jgi:hypothetical protein
VLQVIEALVQYRNAVFGHGAGRSAAFYEHMEPLLLPAANEVLAGTVLAPLGPPGTHLVYLTDLRVVSENTLEIGLRHLVGQQGERVTPVLVRREEAADLVPQCVAVHWPGWSVPLRLDPLLVYRGEEHNAEVLFLNSTRNLRQVEYLSYTSGETMQDETVAPAMARLLSRIAGRTLTEDELAAVEEQHPPESPVIEAHRQPQSTPHEAGRPQATMQVALLYKRHAQPDEEVLLWLETQLKAHGYQVFIDRHLAIGMEWAQEIERQIKNADAIIPLLSAASVQSEMWVST